MFAYAAVSSTLHPDAWVGYLPHMLTDHIAATMLLKFFSVYEVFLTVWLLSGLYIRYCGLLCAATLVGIILSSPGAFIVTFRDVGLVCMALALVVLPENS
jgi:hypothetical protein